MKNDMRVLEITDENGNPAFITPLASCEDEECMYILAQVSDDTVTMYRCAVDDDEITFEAVEPDDADFLYVAGLFEDDFDTLGIDITDLE